MTRRFLLSSCLENPRDGGAWWAAVHGVTTSRTRLSDFTFTFHFHALETEMATHSSVLTWRIPGTGEPGGLPSLGLQSRTRLKRLSSSSSNTPFSFQRLEIDIFHQKLPPALRFWAKETPSGPPPQVFSMLFLIRVVLGTLTPPPPPLPSKLSCLQ